MAMQRSSMPSPCPTPRRSVLNTKRNSHQGIAMSLEKRPPRELLSRIGISGKDVVRTIKELNWDIEEPHGLQLENVYHLPGSKEKGEEAKQNEDYFVGEGELYAYILKQGGARYLLLDEPESSDLEPTQQSKPSKSSKSSKSLEDIKSKKNSMAIKENNTKRHTIDETNGVSSATITEEKRKWKRRKKLSTARSDLVKKTQPFDDQIRSREKSSSVNVSMADDHESIRIESRLKLKHGNISQQAEFNDYEASWKAKGWRAQLLQDIDVHLLRSVAAVDRRHRALEILKEGQKSHGRPIGGTGPHVQDAMEISIEVDGLLHSIRASQDDISSMIEAIIAQAERLTHPDRIDPIGRIGIPGFISTGSSALMLIRDVERYLLLVVAAIRRYQRVRKTYDAKGCVDGLPKSANSASRREKLRALQSSIEESKEELQELTVIIADDLRQLYVEPESPQSTY